MTRLWYGILPTSHMIDLEQNYYVIVYICILFVNSKMYVYFKGIFFFYLSESQ